jgi:hypothetical protein
MKYTFAIEYKGQKIEARDAALYVDGKLTALHDAELSKQAVCSLYSGLLGAVKATPKTYFKKLSFDALVKALQHITATDRFLRRLRMLNAEGPRISICRRSRGGKSLEETVNGEVISTVRTALGDINTSKFSDCERSILSIVSRYQAADPSCKYECHYEGRTLDTYDLERLYKPVSGDDSAVYAKVKEFKEYPFTDYISATDTKKILSDLTAKLKEVESSIADFRKMRDIAGQDAVNWGDHKWASQVKRAGIPNASYAARQWLLRDVRDAMIKQGVKPAEKKLSRAQKLKVKYENEATSSDAGEVSQAELVTLFKAASESQCKDYVAQMDAATSVSLLSMTTKNVYQKIAEHSEYRKEWNAGPALSHVVANVAESSNPVEFKALLSFLKERNLLSQCTWQLFTNHVGHFDIQDFKTFAQSAGPGEFDDSFFKNVLSKLSTKDRYTTNTAITHAFLNVASEAEKIQVIEACAESHSDRDKPRPAISWETSADLFRSLPYGEIRALIGYENMRGEDAVREPYSHFLAEIVRNQDKEIARVILTKEFSPTWYDRDDVKEYYALFTLFSFEEKLSIIDESKADFKLKKVFTETELNQFANVVLLDGDRCQYLPQITCKSYNEIVALSDVLTRIREETFYIPLTESIIKKLSKESAARILARATVISETSYSSPERLLELKSLLYAKLDRKTIEDAVQCALSDHSDRIALAQHMSEQEIIDACERDTSFFKKHVDKAPVAWIKSTFQDKDHFKSVVGDRRKPDNNRLGNAIEAKLAA